MNFTAEVIMDYSKKNPNSRLNKFILGMLVEEITEYCKKCENERMMCVLSPSCYQRFLLDLRIGGGVEKPFIPNFCYQQSISNFRRHLEKKTILYVPADSLLYNEDFLSILFSGIEKPMKKALTEKKYDQIHEIIRKSKVPGIWLKKTSKELFEKIIENSKLIRQGTFLYEGENNYLVSWIEKDIHILDIEKNFTILNVQDTSLEDLALLKLLLKFIVGENLLDHEIIKETNSTMDIKIQIPKITAEKLNNSFHQKKGVLSDDNEHATQIFSELIQDFTILGLKTCFQLTEEHNLIVIFSLLTNPIIRERLGLPSLTLAALRSPLKKLSKIIYYEKGIE